MAPKQKPGKSVQSVGTPKIFLDAVRRRLGIKDFACDLAADPTNAVAAPFYTPEENALVQPWHRPHGRGMWVEGEWNWLNPPFSHIAPWVRRAYETSRPEIGTATTYAAQTAVLIPAGVGANWWRDHVHNKARVLLLNGRITFVGHPTCYPKDCALLLYGPAVTPGYEVWQWTLDAPAVKEAA